MSEFRCDYAERGQDRCPEWRCDCFIDSYPDDPFGLHPEAFVVADPDPWQLSPAEQAAHDARHADRAAELDAIPDSPPF